MNDERNKADDRYQHPGEQQDPPRQDHRDESESKQDPKRYALPELEKDHEVMKGRVQDEAGREIATSPGKKGLQVLDIDNLTDLPDLNAGEELPIDLSVEYWTPERIGETRRMVYTGVNIRSTIDEDTGEMVSLPCAFFLMKTEDGDIRTVCNGGKRLVGAFENNNIKPGTPVSIAYLGKQKNKTNAYSSDTWAIKPLLLHLNTK